MSDQMEFSEEEPMFMFFKRSREEVPSIDEVWDDDYDVLFDPAEEVPDNQIQGYDEAMNFLETADEDYLWVEQDQDVAPVVTVCSTCDSKLQTNSKERFIETVETHRISTGH